MGSNSPLAIEFSSQLDRMEKLLIAAGITSPVFDPASLPTVHLDVEECQKQLTDLKNERPEDVVMRQALELYCSLMSPPATPTSNLSSGYQSQQDNLPVTPAESFRSEREYQTSKTVYNNKPSDHGAFKEHRQAFPTNSQLGIYDLPHACNNCCCSPISFSTDQDLSDSDDMHDDPFASYPLSYSNRLAAYSHPGNNSLANSAHLARSYSATSLSKDTSESSTPSRGSASSVQTPTPQRLGIGHRRLTSIGTLRKTKTPSVDLKHATSQLAFSQGNNFNLNVQPSPESKPSTRKRAFSVVSLSKHRKVHSGGSAALRITGVNPILASNISSPIGTFSAQTQNPRSSVKHTSILGYLSPPREENEDISPIKLPSSQSNLSKSLYTYKS